MQISHDRGSGTDPKMGQRVGNVTSQRTACSKVSFRNVIQDDRMYAIQTQREDRMNTETKNRKEEGGAKYLIQPESHHVFSGMECHASDGMIVDIYFSPLTRQYLPYAMTHDTHVYFIK